MCGWKFKYTIILEKITRENDSVHKNRCGPSTTNIKGRFKYICSLFIVCSVYILVSSFPYVVIMSLGNLGVINTPFWFKLLMHFNPSHLKSSDKFGCCWFQILINPIIGVNSISLRILFQVEDKNSLVSFFFFFFWFRSQGCFSTLKGDLQSGKRPQTKT